MRSSCRRCVADCSAVSRITVNTNPEVLNVAVSCWAGGEDGANVPLPTGNKHYVFDGDFTLGNVEANDLLCMRFLYSETDSYEGCIPVGRDSVNMFHDGASAKYIGCEDGDCYEAT